MAEGFVLPPLYALTRREDRRSHVEQVAAFLAGGARLVQIRDKVAGGRELYDATVAALALANEHGARLIVNDRVDVARAAGAHGVHVGREDLSPGAARAILGPDAIVGVSTHTPEQAREATNEPVDYVAYGPVFATLTKENPDATVGLEGLAAARRIVGDRPLVAIGGIALDRARDVRAAGADSIAVVGDLFAGESIEARVRLWVAALV